MAGWLFLGLLKEIWFFKLKFINIEHKTVECIGSSLIILK